MKQDLVVLFFIAANGYKRYNIIEQVCAPAMGFCCNMETEKGNHYGWKTQESSIEGDNHKCRGYGSFRFCFAYSRKEDGTYDFHPIFKYVTPYVQAADYAVINLETCIGKPGTYCGFPRFLSPDSVIAAAKAAGFKMFLTASNHSYDWGYEGVVYKLKQLKKHGVDFIGSRQWRFQELHKVVEVNGIKIGMLNYTKLFITEEPTPERALMNAAIDRKTGERQEVYIDAKGRRCVATFHEKKTKSFARKLEADIADLRRQGAEIIAVYPHWGTEYKIEIGSRQDKIAQMMCDLGVDVIVGGHPHVVQPVKVYTSEISGKKTLCLHSMGNFFSSMSAKHDKDNAEYTEDGVLFEYTIHKYDDGTAEIVHADVLPTWIRRRRDEREIVVIPLDKGVDWKEKFDTVNYSEQISSGFQSRQRTRKIVDAGLREFNLLHSR